MLFLGVGTTFAQSSDIYVGVPVILFDDDQINMTIDLSLIPRGCSGAIGDFVWMDLNADGVQNADEPGIPSMTIGLYRDHQMISSTVTDEFGYYIFDGLCSGAYEVRICLDTLPGELKPSNKSSAEGRSYENDSVQIKVEHLAADLLGIQNDNATIDFGFIGSNDSIAGSEDEVEASSPCSGVISDFIWMDFNRNGLQDQDEPGIPNVRIELYLKGETNYLIDSTVTDQSGHYVFDGLCNDTYYVMVDPSSLPKGCCI